MDRLGPVAALRGGAFLSAAGICLIAVGIVSGEGERAFSAGMGTTSLLVLSFLLAADLRGARFLGGGADSPSSSDASSSSLSGSPF